MTEQHLVSAILNTFGGRSDLRIWRQNTGAARRAGGGLVRFGTPGQADISGILGPHGRRIEIECKSKRGKQTRQQRRWQRMIEQHGGLYVLARSLEDVHAVLPVDPGAGADTDTAPDGTDPATPDPSRP